LVFHTKERTWIEELNLYASPNINSVIKSRRMRLAGMWHAWGVRNAYKILVGKPEGKNHLEDLGVDGRMILE